MMEPVLHTDSEGLVCVNLALTFPRYRIHWEADGVTKPDWPRADWPWLMEIPCKYGLVHPHGGTVLTAVSTSRRISKRLKALACIHKTAGDPDEMRAWFDVKDAKTVLTIMKPRRNRTGANLEHLRLHQFGKQDA
jgi:hypothetical protein